MKTQFFAYDKNFRGGVNVAVGDVDGDGVSDIITGAASNGDSGVRIFDVYGGIIGDFLAFDDVSEFGINVTAGDINNDGIDEVIASPAIGDSSLVKMFDLNGNILEKMQVFNGGFNKGINVAIMNVYN